MQRGRGRLKRRNNAQRERFTKIWRLLCSETNARLLPRLSVKVCSDLRQSLASVARSTSTYSCIGWERGLQHLFGSITSLSRKSEPDECLPTPECDVARQYYIALMSIYSKSVQGWWSTVRNTSAFHQCMPGCLCVHQKDIATTHHCICRLQACCLNHAARLHQAAAAADDTDATPAMTDTFVFSCRRHQGLPWVLLCLLHTHPRRHWYHTSCQARLHGGT